MGSSTVAVAIKTNWSQLQTLKCQKRLKKRKNLSIICAIKKIKTKCLKHNGC